MACSILGVKNPGQSPQYTPICFIAWRHQFQHVPYFIIPERRGTITGNVFRDDQSNRSVGTRHAADARSGGHAG